MMGTLPVWQCGRGFFLIVARAVAKPSSIVLIRCLTASDAPLRRDGMEKAAGRVKCRLFHTRV